MDTSKLKKFASFARTSLIEQVGTRLKTVLAEQSLARRENAAAVAELEKKIKALGKERVIEMVAYTWFNRFCALRFMDVNQYTTIGTVSPADGFTQPEILTEAKQGVIDEELKVDRAKILGLLDGTRPSQDAQGEVYQQLLIAVCNSYHKLMPFMFEKIADYTELLIPEDLLSDSSVLSETRKALTVENCADVEVIGWLYQFYISEKKDEVFAALKKGKKITPENIPAATQLFTPHWIVRYLVENSLGRLWMLNHPDSRLVEQMDYYIRPEEPETDFLKIGSPEEIKVCDPACGSGHMLTYAFDLLYAIYEEQGYQGTDIPRLILKHNLYGIEIDQRAGALAAFALVMKARQKDRRFFSRKPLDEDSSTAIQNPNVCVLENISIDPEDLTAYMDKVGRDLFSGGLQGVVNQWEEADNFGSLIRPIVTDVSDVLELLCERQMGQDLFLAKVHQQVLTALRQADFLNPKYHVVVTNPPYMGSGAMASSALDFVKSAFPNASKDLMACFMVRTQQLALKNCFSGMINQHSWMFLSSFQELREFFLDSTHFITVLHLGARAFPEISGEVVQSVAFVLRKSTSTSNSQTVFQRLVSFDTSEQKATNVKNSQFTFKVEQSDLKKLPGQMFGYWLNESARNAFSDPPLGALIPARRGLQTGDSSRFIRYWYEVDSLKIEWRELTPESYKTSNCKWFRFNNGGEYRRWYGNLDLIVNWMNNGAEIKATGKAIIPSEDLYFKKGITWSRLGGGRTAFRLMPAGIIPGDTGPCAFPEKDEMLLHAYLNSGVVRHFLEFLVPSLTFLTGDIEKLPYDVSRFDVIRTHVSELASQAVAIAKENWDRTTYSWDFERPPFIDASFRDAKIEDVFTESTSSCRKAAARIANIEAEICSAFAAAFNLDDTLKNPAVEELITLSLPSMRDEVESYIEFSVGCILGRYSVDKPGLILANHGETIADYHNIIPEPTFVPDSNNVLPILEGEWFSDDISQRFKDFLKITFGTEHYEENLKFLEDALYPDNLTAKKRKTIRDYFLKDFYSHHIKLYKKRPIYWLFSSPKGTFNALIYMHRYRPDTVGTVLHYLRDFRDKLMHHADHQQMRADSASVSKSEKTQAIKDVAAIKKQLKELEDYEKTLFEVAARKIDIDLDDGVKHNYQLFGSVLRKIPGLDAKED